MLLAKLNEINTLNHEQESELSEAEIQKQRIFIKDKEWLSTGIIKPSVSPWAAVPCKKKGLMI